MSARVDKQWKDKGLTGYPNEAIFGTLNHYGVTVDEAGLKATSGDKFPFELALEWKPKWKGTGQFAAFPYAAANELFGRLFPDKPSPMKTAHVILDVIANGLKLISGQADANMPGAFGHWDELASKLPGAGERRDAFLGELVTFLESWAQTFNELPERLAKAGKKDEALKVAVIHETLFTDREGTMTAVVRAQLGEKDAALADLTKWASEAGRDVYKRYSALDALFQLGEFEQVKSLGLAIFDAAAAEKKWGLADSIAHLLAHLVQKVGGDQPFVAGVRERLERAHAHTGGHHH